MHFKTARWIITTFYPARASWKLHKFIVDGQQTWMHLNRFPVLLFRCCVFFSHLSIPFCLYECDNETNFGSSVSHCRYCHALNSHATFLISHNFVCFANDGEWTFRPVESAIAISSDAMIIITWTIRHSAGFVCYSFNTSLEAEEMSLDW